MERIVGWRRSEVVEDGRELELKRSRNGRVVRWSDLMGRVEWRVEIDVLVEGLQGGERIG